MMCHVVVFNVATMVHVTVSRVYVNVSIIIGSLIVVVNHLAHMPGVIVVDAPIYLTVTGNVSHVTLTGMVNIVMCWHCLMNLRSSL